MEDEDKKQDPPKEDKSAEEKKVEKAPEEGKAPENKFEGKSTEEILKSYTELSKKLGEQGNELGATKKERDELAANIENWKKLGAVIESDPELFNKVKEKLGVTETPKETNGQAQPDESRLFLRDNIIDRFEERYKIKDLESEKQETLRKKIGSQLQLMLDPKGTGKDLNELMLEVPLNKLPVYFESAYKLATSDDSEEQARLRGIAEASANNNGMIGSIPSSSVNSKETPLTEKEKVAAKKLGVSEKDYAEYKIKQYG